MKKGSLTGKIMLNKYLVGSCIGFGSFGQVYLVYDTQKEQILAMKAEQDKTKNPQLTSQAKIMKVMSVQKGFVLFHHCGYQSKHNVVVMGLLGPSLEDLFNICNRSFSLKTILMLAEQIITRLQTFHSKNYVYRDIKPQNFLMGLHENSHIVHIIDFGLSKKYRDAKNHQHISYRQIRPFVGTVRYCSINTHLGIQYSRRDDLESVGYMLQYFYKGILPWQGIKANTNTQKYAKILQQKQNIGVQIQFMDMPVQFSTYMHYCRSLKFADRPDYKFLKKLFTDLMDKLGYQRDYIYDWCKLKHTTKLQNCTMSLQVFNKSTDLGSTYVTFMSNQAIFQEDIKIDVEQDQQLLVKQSKKDKYKYLNMGKAVDAINQRIPYISQKLYIQDQNQGNIQQAILQDSDLKLISHRNKWYDSYL